MNRCTIQEFIAASAARRRIEVFNILFNRIISLKIDLTTINKKSFISINCQFMETYLIKMFNLSMLEMDKNSTGENIKREILCCLELYSIRIEQVFTITIDNGTNLVKALNLLNEDDYDEDLKTSSFCDQETEALPKIEELMNVFNGHEEIYAVRCVAHTFQLSVNKFLNKFDKSIDFIRNLSKELRCPKYKSLLKNHNVPAPSIDNITRWTSTFEMIGSVMTCRDLINILGESEKKTFCSFQ